MMRTRFEPRLIDFGAVLYENQSNGGAFWRAKAAPLRPCPRIPAARVRHVKRHSVAVCNELAVSVECVSKAY